MSTVKEIIKIMQTIAPEEKAYDKDDFRDRVGLLLGDENEQVKKVLVALDASLDVINEAIAIGAELIITHHPFIFMPLKQINASDLMGRKILLCVKNGINIYSAHTNLDFTKDGINDYLAGLFNLKNIQTLLPYIGENEGWGKVGDITKIKAADFKKEVATKLNDNFVALVGDPNATVARIAILNGGCGDDTKYCDWALDAKADCLITADVKHHVALYAKETGLILIEPQHYTTEQIYLKKLIELLQSHAKTKKLNIEILPSKTEKNLKN